MYPETVTIDGLVFTVHVDYDSDGEIYYYQLQSPTGEFFTECDWQGGFTEEDVLRNL